MKKINYLLLFAVCLFAVCAEGHAQEQATVQTTEQAQRKKIHEEYLQLREQADLWKQKVQENPKDEAAWIGYVTVFSKLHIYLPGEDEEEKQWHKEEEKRIPGMMDTYIPHTATCAILKDMLSPASGTSYGEKAMEIMEKYPDATLHYPYYGAILMLTGDEERTTDFFKRWYDSGTFPQRCLNFSYNEMAGTEKDVVIFWDGSFMDGLGWMALRYGKNCFLTVNWSVFPCWCPIRCIGKR